MRTGRLITNQRRAGRPSTAKMYVHLNIPMYIYTSLFCLNAVKVVNHVLASMKPDQIRKFNASKETRPGNLYAHSYRVALEDADAVSAWGALKPRIRSRAFREIYGSTPIQKWADLGFVNNISYEQLFKMLRAEKS